MIDQCYVGKPVFSLAHGWGVIVIVRPEIHDSMICCTSAIVVKFDGYGTIEFLGDGRLTYKGQRILFFYDPAIEKLQQQHFTPTLVPGSLLIVSSKERQQESPAFGILCVEKETEHQVLGRFQTAFGDVDGVVALEKTKYNFFKMSALDHQQVKF